MKQRIAFFLASLRGGGAEKNVVNLANYFIENGFNVDIVLVQETGPYLRDLHKNVRIIGLNKTRSIYSIFALRMYLLEVNPDALLSHVIHINLVTILAKLLLFKKIKTRIVICSVNSLTAPIVKNGQVKLIHIAQLKLITFLYSLADGIIFSSKAAMTEAFSYKSSLQNRSICIYNPVVTDSMIEYSSNRAPYEKITFVAAGRLEEQKNFSLLINAFFIVKQSLDAQLIILGEGSLRAKLVNQANELGLQNDISFIGFVDDLNSYIKRSDAFVLSSLWEGFGNVIAESLALGVPVVSTDCPFGPSEILCDGKYGQLVPVNNVEALSVAMLKSINSPISKDELVERSKDFLVDRIALQYQHYLLEV